MKERFDKEFLNKKHILSIDTGEHTKEETITMILNFINRNCAKWIM